MVAYHPQHQYAHEALTPAIRGIDLAVRAQTQFMTVPDLLGRDECAELTGVVGGFVRTPVQDGKVDEAVLAPERWPWLYDRLWTMLSGAADVFGLHVTGMYEQAVVLRYGKRDTNGWHSDYDERDRSKVALTCLLEDHSHWGGGDLEVLNASPQPVLLEAGSAVLFSAYLAHRVTPVRKGVRTALVAWAGGPALH